MSDDFRSLYDWYCAHSIDEEEKWYFKMILSLNGKTFLDTILCLYINELEKNKLNWEYDLVFDYIRKRTRAMILGDTIMAWSNYVFVTKEKYSIFYEDFFQAFKKYIANLDYKEFVMELVSIYQKSNFKPKSL